MNDIDHLAARSALVSVGGLVVMLFLVWLLGRFKK